MNLVDWIPQRIVSNCPVLLMLYCPLAIHQILQSYPSQIPAHHLISLIHRTSSQEIREISQKLKRSSHINTQLSPIFTLTNIICNYLLSNFPFKLSVEVTNRF